MMSSTIPDPMTSQAIAALSQTSSATTVSTATQPMAATTTTTAPTPSSSNNGGITASVGSASFPPNVIMRHELPLGKSYLGGTNLGSFERNFRRVAQANHWSSGAAAQMLRFNLGGSARTFIENNLPDDGAFTIDTIFGMLRSRFLTDTALALAAKKLDGLAQKDDESVTDYASRFTTAMGNAGQRDGPLMAIKFFGSLRLVKTKGIPFVASECVDIESVVEKVQQWEISEALCNTRSGAPPRVLNRPDPVDEERTSDEDPVVKPTAKRARVNSVEAVVRSEIDKILRGYAGTQAQGQGAVGGLVHLQSTVDASSAVMPCVVNSLFSEAQRSTVLGNQVNCQLCDKPGHRATECRGAVVCQLCNRKGHPASICRKDHSYCTICRVSGHRAADCMGCQRCGDRSHSAIDCRDGQPGSYQPQAPRARQQRYQPYDGTGRNENPRDERVCYGCNSKGHILRDCPSRRTPPLSGANATEVRSQRYNSTRGRGDSAGNQGN
jgi:hypothetical protein